MTDKPRVRFAPSPTGMLHVGHLRAAVPNALFARRTGGTFILRLEDTDLERNVPEAEKAILEDLKWLGFEPQESFAHGGDYAPYRMSESHAQGKYKTVVDELIAAGRAYECFVSEDELEVMRKLQRSRNEPPRYDNRHRNLSDAEKAAFKAEGRTPVIRFRLRDGEVKFTDLVRGEVKFDAANLGGDPVIVRGSGVPLFTLAGVVDDINQKISHVIRGEDHVSNTAIQVQIYEALGATQPIYAHVPMMLDAEGHKFSKRRGSLRISDLRAAGYLPQALVSYMACMGFSFGPEPRTLDELAELFDLTQMSRSPARFEESQLTRTNATFIHSLSYAQAKPYLQGFMPETAEAEALWNATHANLETLADLKDQYQICFGDVSPAELDAEDQAYIQAAAANLPEGALSEESWSTWVNTLKDQTGRKGKALFMPLRLALTGQQHGAELAPLFTLMGRERVLARLNAVVKAAA
jgi:glutamyl-tRNA synthetase